MVQFEDHVAYIEPPLRPVLRELRSRILALGRMEENPTPAQRITYSVARIFVEIKVQKKRILARVFDMGVPDPKVIATNIPGTHKWQHQKQIPIETMKTLEYAMPFIEASYRSSLTKSPTVPFWG